MMSLSKTQRLGQWRLLPGELTPELAERIRRMTVLYGRADRPAEPKEKTE